MTFRKEISVAVVRPNAKRVSAQEFEGLIQELTTLVERERFRQVLLDMADVQYLHSAGLAKLLGFHRKLAGLGGQLKLCGLQPVVRELLELTQFDQLLDIYDDEPAAMATFD
jgi:anti-sigma B factor antagonist